MLHNDVVFVEFTYFYPRVRGGGGGGVFPPQQKI